ncbi:glycosyl hydrolases family 18-domain-containing protein [Mycena filopes]|nr:glycosyl hydrolases family 18-domain-containing protein [Mycena filopes]
MRYASRQSVCPSHQRSGFGFRLNPRPVLTILAPALSQNTPTNATSLPIGSCTPDIPCSNGACCNGGTGFCGFGDKFCGAAVCTSNCNAQAECGVDAPPQNTTCPLATTRPGRLPGLSRLSQPIPTKPTIELNHRACMSYTPEKISAETLTHINFAFALISSSFNVVEMTEGDSDLWKRTTALKSRNPTLQVFLSIGGWTFNDPPTQKIFSDLVGSAANTKTFISSLLKVFEAYGFDGLDVDWEYPGASDRGGIPADTKNYVTFMAAVKQAFSGPGYGLTFTAPSSFWYLQHFDLPNLLKHADWVNVMTYDLHGTWDGHDIWIGPIVAAHTNLTEINEAFKLYWRNGVDPSQMVMGLGFYGRSFTLASADCADPGCIWASGANAGPCSGQAGILMYNEIQSILGQTDDSGATPSPALDEDAAVKYVVWDTNQWVSYDDSETFAIKMNYANDRKSRRRNCQWYGSPPLCHDNACPIGQILLTTDTRGDASKSCSGSGTRSYCCDFNGHDETPLPFDDIFPSGTPEGSLSFQEEFDPDEGVADGKTGSGSSSPLPNDQDENDTAFGEVFIDSPNAASVSSLELTTNWVITGCHPTSDQPQSVLAYCSTALSTSECSHVMIGGAENTIVKMPANCGRGPYARVASFTPHPDQNILSSFHQSNKPAAEPVYSLQFDYNFAAIPASNGPIYMRADVTDMPDYWDTVVDSPPERKRWLQERGLEERWWGTFKSWLSKMTTVEKDTSVSRNFHWSDTWTIFHKEVSCPGPPQFEASIDVSLTGQASLNTRYGFYLQATVVPPAVQAAYLYFSADAKAHGLFTMKGEATVQYDSSNIQFASFGFPGLYYPGLLTVGPTLTLNGYVTGSLSVSGQFTTSIGYTFPTVNFNMGKTDPDVVSTQVTPSDFTSGFLLTAGYNVELAGDLSIHVVPSIQLGLSVLGGAVIDAQAFVDVDLYGGMRINGSVSNSHVRSFLSLPPGFSCRARSDAGLTGNVLYWETGPLSINFYKNEQEIYGQVFIDRACCNAYRS